MTDNVIPFPGKSDGPHLHFETRTAHVPRQLFTIDNQGRVDLVDGVEVSDAVEAFWSALRDVVTQAWHDGPAEHERARVRLLVGYLDKVRPGWRNDIAWTD